MARRKGRVQNKKSRAKVVFDVDNTSAIIEEPGSDEENWGDPLGDP